MLLSNAAVFRPYQVEEVLTKKEELKIFLFSLGFAKGEIVTILSKKKNNLIVMIKDSRYGIDIDLASNIEVKEV